MKSHWTGVGPKSYDSVLTGRGEDTETQRAGQVKTQAEAAAMWPQPRNRSWKRKEGPPLDVQGKYSPAGTLVGLLASRTVRGRWLLCKPPGWWSFVTAAPGHAVTQGGLWLRQGETGVHVAFERGRGRSDCHFKESCCVTVPTTPGS